MAERFVPALTRTAAFRLALAAALVLSALYLAVVDLAGLARGLTREIWIDPTSRLQNDGGPQVGEYIGSESFDKERRDAGLPGAYAYKWSGVWDVPESAAYLLYVGADNDLTLTLDGRTVIQRTAEGSHDPVVTPVALDSGPHALFIAYLQGPTDHLTLAWGSDGTGPRPFGQADLYPSLRTMRLYHLLAPLKWAAIVCWLLAAAAAATTSTMKSVRTPARAVVVCVLVYAALLRFDALVGRWGVVPGPAGAEAAERQIAAFVRQIRPPALGWIRSPFAPGGDPYAYLQQARERTRFYAAHLREPLFVFTVKGFLHLLGQADQAVLVASAAFSWLTVLATAIVGACAFSPWVGAGAALALAIERDVIGMGVAGYRDEAFGFFVLTVTWASLWVQDRPASPRWAVWGLVAGAACLTRLTALTLVVPVLGYLAVSTRADARFKSAAVGLLMFALVVSPFLINSWLAFGNPFYAVTGLWSTLAQSGSPLPATSSQYLLGRFLNQPIGTVDTLWRATAYSFQNKWQGFDAWSTLPIGGPLSGFACLGLLIFCWRPRGRLLLFVLLISSAPFLAVWDMPNGNEYRYTLHAYPFLLIAAFAGIEGLAVESARTILAPRRWSWAAERPMVTRALVTAVAVGAAWLAILALPYARMLEELRQNGRTVVAAGPRDHLFFRSGWHAPVTVGNVTARFSRDREATVWVPMVAGHDATLTVRLDPFVYDGAPPQDVRLTLNGAALTTLTLRVDPSRFGSYTVDVPRPLVHGGLNRLDLAASYSTLVGSVPRPARLLIERPATFAETERALDVTRSVPTPDTRRPASFEATLSADQRVGFRLWYVLVATRPDAASISSSSTDPG